MLGEINLPKGLQENEANNLDELWTEIRKRNSNALSTLFCLSYSWLFDYGYKVVPREGFVKDAIQELFLNLWEKRKDINEAHSVKAYLLSSFRRIVFRRLEKQKNRIKRNYDYKENTFDDLYNIEELIIHFETGSKKKKELARAIKSLSKRQREVIYLKFYNGLSSKEIAIIMDINRQSVYNHVSMAISKMQEFVEV